MDIIKKKTKKRSTTSDEPGLVITRKVGNAKADSIYIGEFLKISVIDIRGKQVRLKFINRNGHNIKIDRVEGWDKINAKT